MVARGAVQKAAHDRAKLEDRAAARGQRTATTSNANDQTGSTTASIRTRRNRLRKVKIRL